jgi:hypothetical protein
MQEIGNAKSAVKDQAARGITQAAFLPGGFSFAIFGS